MIKDRIFKGEYAGHPVVFRFRQLETSLYFGRFLSLSNVKSPDVEVSDDLMARARPLNPPGTKDSYVEYRCLIALVSRFLLRYDCCIFHCASFLWRGYVWLLTAPSGTGKTTQYMNWLHAHPGEITMLSGDMPVLELREDGSIWAHPTTWNGKENIGNRFSAPVAGVVYLEQGKENVLSSASASELVMPLFRQILGNPETEEQIRAMGRILDRMLRTLPVWKLVNLGDPASTELIRSAFAARLAELPPRPDPEIPNRRDGSELLKGEET